MHLLLALGFVIAHDRAGHRRRLGSLQDRTVDEAIVDPEAHKVLPVDHVLTVFLGGCSLALSDLILMVREEQVPVQSATHRHSSRSNCEEAAVGTAAVRQWSTREDVHQHRR